MSTEAESVITSPDVARLSDRARHAIKVALALVIAYGLALQWGWLNPQWAGFAIAFCSLATRGESLNKTALRLCGTALAVFAAFFFLALFPQDRWWFVAVVGLYCVVVSYLMTGSRAQYFWHVAGFVCLIITLTGPSDPTNVFEHGMARAYETALGCVIWGLVDVLVWPVTNRTALLETARQLVATQKSAYRMCGDHTLGRPDRAEFLEIRGQLTKLLSELHGYLGAAGAESPEVREARTLWMRFERESKVLVGDLDRWYLSCRDLRDVDVQSVVPGLEQFFAETDAESASHEGGLRVDAAQLARLPNFDRAAVTTVVRRIESVSVRLASLRNISRALTDADDALDSLAPPPEKPKAWQLPVPDPDRLRGATFVLANLWLGFLLWIFYDPPGHAVVYMIPPAIGFAAALTPQMMLARGLLATFAIYLPVAGVLYLWVMPQLSGYGQLAVLIFLYVFWVQYSVTQPLAKIAAMIGFVGFVTITNEQTYSFVGFASGYLALLISVLVVVVCSYLLGSPRPEKMVPRLVRRYLRSAAFVVSRVGIPDGAARTVVGRYLSRFHIQQLEVLPGKLAAWGGQVDHVAFAGNGKAQVDLLVTSLEGFTYRLVSLIDARSEALAAGLTEVFSEDTAAWREDVAALLEDLSRQLSADSLEDLEERERMGLAALESGLGDDMAQRHDAAVVETLYHLLGACRGVSAGLAGYVDAADGIDWECWREERF